ncbi:MAG: hypothetical protein IT436_09420 [Phycisphaerales bacterium]|nr:hypothetical protein [Phycisphaerales bacterium]
MHLTARTAWTLAGIWLTPALLATSPFPGPVEPECRAAHAAVGWAGPLNREWVDEKASWVIHFDVEAAMRSTIGRFLLANRDKVDLGPLDAVYRQTGFDPLTDLKSVTVYGLRGQPDERIRLIRATPALDAAIARMRQPDILIQSITSGTWSLEAWSRDDWKRFGYVAEGTGEDDRVLIFSGNQFTTAQALEVQAGRAPSLSNLADSVMATLPPEGSMLFIAADDVAGLFGSASADSALGQLADDFTLNIGEAPSTSSPGQTDCCIDITIKTRSFDEATKLSEVLRGAIAVGKQITKDDPSWTEARKLLDAIGFSTSGTTVTARGRWNAESIGLALQSRKSTVKEGSGGGTTPAPPAPPALADLFRSP